jgi:hypothetical protein
MADVPVVKTEFNYQDLDFSSIGFLNYIIRYGGGTEYRDENPLPFRPIRKFVLETADTTQEAESFFKEKFFTYVSQERRQGGVADTRHDVLGGKNPFGPRDLPEKIARETEEALRCPAYYKVLPSIELHTEKGLLASNQAFGSTQAGIRVNIQNCQIDKISEKKYGDGSLPVRQGRLTLQFSSENKKTEILRAIADPKNDLLGWIFDVTKEYRITLKNDRRTQNWLPKAAARDRKAYEALIASEISFLTTTIKYELSEWKPHQNKVTFIIHFADSVKGRDEVTKADSGEPEVPVGMTDALQRAEEYSYKYNLTKAILKQLEKNNSLFAYSFMQKRREEERYLYMVQPVNGSAVEPSEYQTSNRGVFFLLRSLIFAVVQTYYEKETQLDRNLLGDIFFSEETYKNLVVGISEDVVPTALIEAPFWDRDDDVRNTYETIAIDTNTFTQFMDSIFMEKGRITIDFLLERIFNVLVSQALKANIAKPTTSSTKLFGGDAQVSFVGTSRLYCNLNSVNIDKKPMYTTRFVKLGNDQMNHIFDKAKTRRAVELVKYYGSARTLAGGSIRLNPNNWGALKFKVTNTFFLQAALNAANSQKTGILINANTSARETKESSSSTQQVKNKQVLDTKTGRSLHKAGIIKVNWFDRKNPEENVRYRFVSKDGSSPFKFSVLDNKHLANIKRQEGGISPFFHNIYTCKFSIYDYLGVEPYGTKFYFPPSFFGFDDVRGGYGIGDAFGLTGVYTPTKTSISYSKDQPVFVNTVTLTATQEIQVRPRSTKTLTDSAAPTPVSKEDKAFKDKMTKAQNILEKQHDELEAVEKQIREQEAYLKKLEKRGGAEHKYVRVDAKTGKEITRPAIGTKKDEEEFKVVSTSEGTIGGGFKPTSPTEKRSPAKDDGSSHWAMRRTRLVRKTTTVVDVKASLIQLKKDKEKLAAKYVRSSDKVKKYAQKYEAKKKKKDCPPAANKDCK